MCVTQVTFPSGVSTVVFMDNGSNCSLITHSLANKLGLQGRFSREWVELAGKAPELMDVKYYKLKWTMPDGSKRSMRLLGLEKITSSAPPVDVSPAYALFPHIPKGSLDRPEGEVGILLGLDQVDLHAGGGMGIDQVGTLRVLTLPHDTGYVLIGHHPQIQFQDVEVVPAANTWKMAKFPDYESFSSGVKINFFSCNSANIMDFQETELLGVSVPRRCKPCQQCTTCFISEDGRTIQEEKELQMMRDGLKYDEERKKVQVTYPIVGDINKFKDNYVQVTKMADSLWKSLKRRNLLDPYHDQVKDYILRGVWGKTSLEKVQEWKDTGGKVHYVSHHGVLNSHSTTTPLRIVVNSALKNCYDGPSLNDLYGVGPNKINNLISVLITWRSFEQAIIYDVSKAYHSMETGPEEFFMRLVVWKFKEEDDWDVYGHEVVGMGDPPASIELELTKEVAADKGKMIDAKAAKQLKKQSYVDDGLGGGNKQEIMRMRGEIVKGPDGKMSFTGTIAQILATVGFKAKTMICSGDTDPDLLSKMSKVLGLEWIPSQDVIRYKLTFNLHKRNGASKAGPDLTEADIPMILTLTFTKRLALTVTAQIYDPLGILCSFTIRFKLQLRTIVQHGLDWDEPLPDALQQVWRNLISQSISAKALVFPRSLMIPGVVGRPEVCGFWDGSDLAYAGCVYVRWKLEEENSWWTTLVTAKTRVTPQAGCTTPRAELSGLVLLARLVDKVIKALDIPPIRITLMGDSTCTISACEVNCASLKPFFSNRVMEILHLMDGWGKKSGLSACQELGGDVIGDMEHEVLVDELMHVAGPLNVADYPSRGNLEWQEMDEGSLWQQGPSFLRENRVNWPVNRDFISNVPQEETKSKFFKVVQVVHQIRAMTWRATPGEGDIPAPLPFAVKVMRVMWRWNKLSLVRRTMARLCHAQRYGDSSLIEQEPSPKDFREADWWMRWLSMPDTLQALKNKRKEDSSLTPFWSEGLLVVRGRLTPKSMKTQLGHEQLILLSNKSRLAYLILTACHEEDHRKSPADALWRSRTKGYWIINGMKLSKQITRLCFWCKKQSKTTITQRMGDLPDVKFMTPCRPFSHITLDLAGPYQVYDCVKGRTLMKTWAVVFVCLNTGSVHVELAKAYTASAFLVKFKKFISYRGCPSYVYSDMGSNLVKANKVMDSTDFPWEQAKKMTAEIAPDMTWRHAPSQAQHRDGASEACIKMLKATMKHMVKGGPLAYDEFDTCLAMAANALNERPLSVRVHSGAEPGVCPVTPNLLLLGQRTFTEDLAKNFVKDEHDRANMRMALIQESFHQWWQEWYVQVFPQLVPVKKWRSVERNMRVGDIVLVRFATKVPPAKYRLGRVVEVKTDPKGLVRSCLVGMRPRDAREKTLPYRSKDLLIQEIVVQRLVVFLPVEEQEVVDPDRAGVLDDGGLHVCPDAVRGDLGAGVQADALADDVQAAGDVPSDEKDVSPGDGHDDLDQPDDVAADASDDGHNDPKDALAVAVLNATHSHSTFPQLLLKGAPPMKNPA